MCKIENSTDGKSEKRQTKQQQNADKYQRSSGCVRTKLHLNLYICLQHRIKFYIFCIVTTAPTERRRGFFQLELVCKHYIRQCFTVEPAGTDYAWKTENTPLAAHQTHTTHTSWAHTARTTILCTLTEGWTFCRFFGSARFGGLISILSHSMFILLDSLSSYSLISNVNICAS